MNTRKAFTLTELLVVVAILALLVSLLMPTLRRAKDLARKAVCAARMHDFGVAIGTYVMLNDSYPFFAPRPYRTDPAFWPADPRKLSPYRLFAYPKFYAVLETIGIKGTHRTSYGTWTYVLQPDEVWDGGLCPAMDAPAIWRWGNDMADHGVVKYSYHRAAIGYSWNMALRSATPHRPRSLLAQGRWPASLWVVPGTNMGDDSFDNTKWINWPIFLPDGRYYGANAVRPQEIDEPDKVAEAWDSPDVETAPNADVQSSWSVELLAPGWHAGPQSLGTNGWAMLNGSRHPGSPNILYADGSVRADATKELKPADLGPCPAGRWVGIRANSWGDADYDPTFGTMWHIAPKRQFH